MHRVPPPHGRHDEELVTALSELHKSREVAPLVDLFADDATLNKAQQR